VIIDRFYENLLKILVTGGAGFIGRNIVRFFLEKNAVVIYDNLSNSLQSDVKPLVKRGAEFVNGDILDYQTLQKSTERCDAVIHLAALSGVLDSIKNPEITYKVNVDGTENVIKCCAQNKIKKFIFASSAAVYSDSKVPITEQSDTDPPSPYGKSKLAAENIIKKYSQEFQIDAISLRMFNVYGKGQNAHYSGVITRFIENILQEKPIQINGDGKQTRDFVSIFDVIDAFDCAIKKIQGKRGNIYNIGSGKATTINQLAEILQNIVGKKIQINHVKQKTNEVRFSLSDTLLAKKELGFVAKRKLEEELKKLL
jgi:UDP-glucose 4-epimerase